MNTKSSGGVATATPWDQQITELIELFEKEIESGEHALQTRESRSKGWERLLVRGQEALGPIVAHLVDPDSYKSSSDLDEAWGDFLRELAENGRIPGVPAKGSKLSDFIAWARRQTTVI